MTARQPSVPNLMGVGDRSMVVRPAVRGSRLSVLGESVISIWSTSAILLLADLPAPRATRRVLQKKAIREPTTERRELFLHTSLFSFFSSRYFTTLPTSCEF